MRRQTADVRTDVLRSTHVHTSSSGSGQRHASHVDEPLASSVPLTTSSMTKAAAADGASSTAVGTMRSTPRSSNQRTTTPSPSSLSAVTLSASTVAFTHAVVSRDE